MANNQFTSFKKNQERLFYTFLVFTSGFIFSAVLNTVFKPGCGKHELKSAEELIQELNSSYEIVK